MLKTKTGFLAILLVLIAAAPGMSAAPPSMSDTLGRLNSFIANTEILLDAVMSSGDLAAFVDSLWTTLTIILLVTIIGKYAMSGITLVEVIHPLLLIVITRIMLNHYDYLTSLCWDWSEGIARSIQQAAIGDGATFFVVGFFLSFRSLFYASLF